MKEIKVKHFNAKLEKGKLWVILFVIIILCIIIIPFFITFIANVFSGKLSEPSVISFKYFIKLWLPWIPWQNLNISGEQTELVLGTTLLPDFLGGMAGILVGFILDFSIINKIKAIGQFESMLEPLNAEFNEILRLYWKAEKVNGEEKINKYGYYIISSIEAFGSIFGETNGKVASSLFLKYNPIDNDKYNEIRKRLQEKGLNVKEVTDEESFRRLVFDLNAYCDKERDTSLNYLSQMPGKMLNDILTDYENCAILYSIPNKFGIEKSLRDINHMIKIVKDSKSMINYEVYETFQQLVKEKIKSFYKKVGIDKAKHK